MKGLVLGKFMPVHKGHLALIDFALSHCNSLIILLCHHAAEPISNIFREAWLNTIFKENSRVEIVSLEYDPSILTDSSDSSAETAKPWADAIEKLDLSIDTIVSSEGYGELLARFLNITSINFDISRNQVPVSASNIRQQPFTYWKYIPKLVQPYFVKKVCIVGSESTGKSTLTKRLAERFTTDFVAEMAREVIGHTNDSTFEQLKQIAEVHAKAIKQKLLTANKVLFIDTDITITKSYSLFLFNKELVVPDWIEKLNEADLYFFLETDCPFVQDGTRLRENKREQLNISHKNELRKQGIYYISIFGDWEQRFENVVAMVNTWLSKY